MIGNDLSICKYETNDKYCEIHFTAKCHNVAISMHMLLSTAYFLLVFVHFLSIEKYDTFCQFLNFVRKVTTRKEK